ncbi:hypothetical protein BDV41DRAFT_526597 [Aspergillus transmontanensis]|uniref:Uncharacterized protein n=1 Tax=Aspergillus transmontanensis TaxID=1034304 RepID=A0A5N6W9A7_9EURO|nr:hypothetical protein BDV41DRAFT_529071 [Aspergillus transmontanensis]KAE8317441.1 hypothetical protein BDV41DRAFT_526597 [Aspergillus transmontanensis]
MSNDWGSFYGFSFRRNGSHLSTETDCGQTWQPFHACCPKGNHGPTQNNVKCCPATQTAAIPSSNSHIVQIAQATFRKRTATSVALLGQWVFPEKRTDGLAVQSL